MEQLFGEKFLSKGINGMQTLRYLLLLNLFGSTLGFLNFYIVTIGQPFKRFYIAVFFVFHQESNGIATLSATKAFIDFLYGGYRKRR